MCTKFSVDISSRFSFRVRTHTDSHRFHRSPYPHIGDRLRVGNHFVVAPDRVFWQTCQAEVERGVSAAALRHLGRLLGACVDSLPGLRGDAARFTVLCVANRIVDINIWRRACCPATDAADDDDELDDDFDAAGTAAEQRSSVTTTTTRRVQRQNSGPPSPRRRTPSGDRACCRRAD